jgi:hypothetical protein
MTNRAIISRNATTAFRIAATLGAVLFLAATGRAGVTFYSTFKNQVYTQNSTAQPSTPSSYFASGVVNFSNASDLNSATVTFAGSASPLVLASAGTGVMNQNVNFASLGAMDAAFPSTSYQFAVGGGNLGSQNGSLSTPASDLFASQVPYLSDATYTNLHGMNASNSQQLTWDGYTPSPGINDADIFLIITRFSNGQEVFDSGALSNTQTSLVLPASTLLPSIKYQFELDYSSRINTPNAGFGTASSLVGFDLRAQGTFTTGLPEPASGFGILVGLLAIATRRRVIRA